VVAIVVREHHRNVLGLVLIVSLLVLVGPLAVFFGADSRFDEVARRRRLDG
jgi:hypothetical protein